MAITLASDALSDAEITDGIGLGDLESAARLWVRHWPTALAAARRYVGPDEVPGLAAEALIATVSAIAIGRGPREDVRGFVADAVRELGEDDEVPVPGPEHPAVFTSPMMTSAFRELDPELQDVLRTAVAVGQLDAEGVRALTVLQHYYLAEHTDRAETPACRRAHVAMMSVADSSSTEGVPGATWLHMSTCAWCTEAFHEIAFSNVALGALVAPSALVAPAPTAPPLAAAPAADLATTFLEPEPDGVLPVPEEEDDDDLVPVAAAGAAHVGSRRGRLVAVGIAAAAAVSVVGVVLVGQNNDTTAPTAAGTDAATRSAPASTAPPTASTDPVTGVPSKSATVDAPLARTTSAMRSAAAAPTAPARSTAQSTGQNTVQPKPSKAPVHSPSPTRAPTTAPATPTPTPKPSPTPSPCNRLQHLLHVC